MFMNQESLINTYNR